MTVIPANPTGPARPGAGSVPAVRPIRDKGIAPGIALAVAVALAIGSVAPLAQAEIYRWVDEAGETVYSQLPPPAGNADKVRPAPGPSRDEREQARARTRAQVEQDFDRQEDSAKQAGGESAKAGPAPATGSEDPAKAAEAQAKKTANCEVARKNLDTLQNHGKGRIKTPDGKVGFLSKDQLAAQIAEARAQIGTNCQ
jgi:hypothetical protein